jgi:antitoxin component YwqK of YwqJK toxin-antitoxin module
LKNIRSIDITFKGDKNKTFKPSICAKMKKLLFMLFFTLALLPLASAQNQTDARGLKQGPWAGTYGNGAIRYRGQFQHGVPYGTFTYFYPTGAIKAKMKYSHHGHVAHVQSFHLNGKLMAEGKYLDRKKDSTWLYFSNIDGKKVLEENYSKGIKEGATIIYFPKTEHPSELTEYKQGKKNGKWIRYFPDGKISTSGFYVNDTLQGSFQVYDVNGKLLMKGQYKNAMQDGLWQTYDSLGRVTKKVFYHNGIPAKQGK